MHTDPPFSISVGLRDNILCKENKSEYRNNRVLMLITSIMSSVINRWKKSRAFAVGGSSSTGPGCGPVKSRILWDRRSRNIHPEGLLLDVGKGVATSTPRALSPASKLESPSEKSVRSQVPTEDTSMSLKVSGVNLKVCVDVPGSSTKSNLSNSLSESEALTRASLASMMAAREMLRNESLIRSYVTLLSIGRN